MVGLTIRRLHSTADEARITVGFTAHVGIAETGLSRFFAKSRGLSARDSSKWRPAESRRIDGVAPCTCLA